MGKFLIKSDLPIETQRKIDAIELIPVAERTANQTQFLTALTPYLTNLIISVGEDGLINYASGLTVPTGTSGFRKGAMFVKTDASGNGEYMNIGSTTVSSWDLVDEASTANIPDGAVTPAKLSFYDTPTTTYTITGTLKTYKDNASSFRLSGKDYGGTTIQSYGGVYYDIVFGAVGIGGHGVGNLHTRMITGSNESMDMEMQTPNCMLLSAVDDGDTPTDVNGRIQMNVRAGVSFNARAVGDVEASDKLTIDRVDKSTVGATNTSAPEISTTSGKIKLDVEEITLGTTGVKIFTGAATNAAGIFAAVGGIDAIGSIYMSVAGTLWSQISDDGDAGDWKQVTTS